MVQVRAEVSGDAWRCEVSVEDRGQRTHHVVTVTPADLARWGGGNERQDVEDLVSRSFTFLLERERPDEILGTFDLSVIQRYFPDYDIVFSRK